MMRWVKYFPSLEDRVDLKLRHTGANGGLSDQLSSPKKFLKEGELE